VLRYLLLAPILQNVELQYLIAAIVADDEFGIDIVVRSGPKRLDGVHAAAIAREPITVCLDGPGLIPIAPGMPTPNERARLEIVSQRRRWVCTDTIRENW